MPRIGRGLALTFGVLIALIVGGNSLILWQFRESKSQVEHLTGSGRQLSVVLGLQQNLLILHQRLDELAQQEDWRKLEDEAPGLLSNVLDQAQRTRTALHETQFLPTLDAIEISLPAQIDAVRTLAREGDTTAVQARLAKQLQPLEVQSSFLVNSFDRQVRADLDTAIATVEPLHERILLIVPMTALTTFVIASFFGWTITRRMTELRLEERVEERTRIARELHDTFLQSLHGLLFKFQAARNMLPDRSAEAMRILDDSLARTEQAITEGRDAIHDLRHTPATSDDLVKMLISTCEELARDQADGRGPAFSAMVEGDQRTLAPDLRTEIYRIGREVLRNAFSHASASRIEIEVRFT